MVLIKNYLTLQTLVLYSFKLLSADEKAHKVLRKEVLTPRIVDGPGKIVDVSEKSHLKKESDKSINDLLHELYKKFSNGAKGHSTDRKRSKGLKGTIIETDALNFLQKKTKKALPSKLGKKTAATSTNKNQKEQQKLRLKDLEKTIDKLIGSMSRVPKDGNYATREINEGIDDLSRFGTTGETTPSSGGNLMKKSGRDLNSLKTIDKEMTEDTKRTSTHHNEEKDFKLFKGLLYRLMDSQKGLSNQKSQAVRDLPRVSIKKRITRKDQIIKIPPPGDYTSKDPKKSGHKIVISPVGDQIISKSNGVNKEVSQLSRRYHVDDNKKQIIPHVVDKKQIYRIPLNGKRKVAPNEKTLKPGERFWYPTFGKKSIPDSDQNIRIVNPGKRELTNEETRNKLETLTIALVKIFNFINEEDFLAYEKKHKKVQIISPSKQTVPSTSGSIKLNIPTQGVKEVSNKILLKRSLYRWKVSSVKAKLVEIFYILNSDNLVGLTPTTITPVSGAKHATDDDILDTILSGLKEDHIVKKKSMSENVVSEHLRKNDSNNANVKHLEKRILQLLNYVKNNKSGNDGK